MNDESGPQPSLIPAAPGAGKKKVKNGRLRRFFRRLTSTKKGVFALVATSILFTAAIVGGTMWFIPYSESVAFCTTCHTMIPQHKAYEVSPHADVPCGECHVAPTLQGWIQAKMAGTQELKALILNNYPTPIPPIPHEDMPPNTVTCMKCHSLDRINTPGNPIRLILRPRYETDEANTMQQVAVAIRPTGLGTSRSATASGDTEIVDTSSGDASILNPQGVHWHVATPVSVYATNEERQEFPLVEYTNDKGQVESFIRSSDIGLASNVTPDIDRLKTKLEGYTMQCIDCHNMVGHNIPDPSRLLDESLAKGTISPDLPYIKRDALDLLNRTYITEEAAQSAITAFGTTYAADHPDLATSQPDAIPAATEEVRRIYGETATPAMGTVWTSYPDNLGHQRSPGCFRCHDGNHVKVVDGEATDEVIPSTCSTCHTFPQVGSDITGLQMGVPPTSHAAPLYVFSHKDGLASTGAPFEPNPTAAANCATCHQKSYCENCHNSGAVKVNHDEMLFNHAASARTAGLTACAYCHQPVYCATCHSNDDTVVQDMTLAQGRLNGGSQGVGE